MRHRLPLTHTIALQIGILPYAGVDIAIFEILKDEVLEAYDGNPPPSMILGAGMFSSSLAQFVSYPLAVVRTRLQVGTRHRM
jgi:solute carrier family 25 phosphate transporter 23/24/25/41